MRKAFVTEVKMIKLSIITVAFISLTTTLRAVFSESDYLAIIPAGASLWVIVWAIRTKSMGWFR